MAWTSWKVQIPGSGTGGQRAGRQKERYLLFCKEFELEEMRVVSALFISAEVSYVSSEY